MLERETPLRTLSVAGGVALFCSLLVATAVQLLKPLQLAHAQVERNRSMLVAAGLTRGAESSDLEVATAFLDLQPRLFDTVNGRFTSDIDLLSYDYRAAGDDPNTSRALPPERDPAGIGRLARYLPLYISLEPETAPVVIVPIYGRGMWSTIYGHVALTGDFDSIAGVSFYEHGETPGIGDRIENPSWQAQWRGKRALDADRSVRLRIAAPERDIEAEFRIDAITGATVTVAAIERCLRFWLGPDGYGEALRQLAEEFRAARDG